MSRALFYRHFGGSPDFNMAFDEWMLGRALSAPGMVLLRLYTWEPTAITIGCNQRLERAVDQTRLGETPLVRRLTGGRAIYHDRSELTYAIALGTAGELPPKLRGTLSQTSISLAAALQAFLSAVGVSSDLQRASSARNADPAFFHRAPCFASHARYELMRGDRKIVASAQKRLPGAMLQHGSIKLAGIAPHPALTDPPTTLGDLKPVDCDEFMRLSILFAKDLCDYLALSHSLRDVFTAVECDEVEERRRYVEKNRLGQRHVIEQKCGEASH